MKSRIPDIPNYEYRHNSGSYLLIAGPCVIESEELLMTVAGHLCTLSDKFQIPLLFKSSYRKANRSRSDSFAGIGDIDALKILSKVRDRFFVPVITDIHNPDEAQHGDLGILQENDVLLVISNSGKTREILELIDLPENLYKAIPVIAITGAKNTPVCEKADCVITTGNPKEVCPLDLTKKEAGNE